METKPEDWISRLTVEDDWRPVDNWRLVKFLAWLIIYAAAALTLAWDIVKDWS